MGSAMVFAGIAHLTFKRKEFQAQVPRWLPANQSLMDVTVLSSGIVEITLGVLMILWKEKRISTGLMLALFYILIFPGNISQYTNRIDAFGLDTDTKRFIRLLFQPLLVYGALWSTGADRYLIEKFNK
ncbi:membrane protein [Zunongwangia profunda SM-A87]|uniref:Membrane protein n=2 Tax=Zunongwangia profunda TaxID=398743 RepID=D5BIA4_ZUNPS|nr:membrane protein [Zunongwangia profunda SM-A87]|tara:strand:+ start:333 stop:716 length:384 start_codon:yes stop_codon:yes gene_type:complete